MAIFHTDVKIFSRSKGDSAVAAAAYRARANLTDERTGLVHNYSNMKDLLFTEMLVPEGSKHFADFSDLWNAVEEKERRKNSAVAREFEVGLPVELDQEQNKELAKGLSQNLVDRFGFALQYSIHWKDNNPHVHILASTRKLEAESFTAKTRELDDFKTGAVEEVRGIISTTINQHLKRANQKGRVDHRSLAVQQAEAEAQGDWVRALDLSRAPQKHVGKGKGAKQRQAYNEKIKAEHEAKIQELIEKIDQDLKEQEEAKAAAKKKKPLKV